MTLTDADLYGRRPLLPRFIAHVQNAGRCGLACWLWLAPLTRGAPRFHFRGRHISARRLAYALAFGVGVPAEAQIVSTCRRSRCVRPDHLRLRIPPPPRMTKPRIILNPEKAAAMREARSAGKTLRALGEHFHVSESMACLVVNGKRWRHV